MLASIEVEVSFNDLNSHHVRVLILPYKETLDCTSQGYSNLASLSDVSNASHRIFVIPKLLSLLPPLVTLISAFKSKSVLVALFSGTYLAAFFSYEYNPVMALLRMFDTVLVAAVTDQFHVKILILILLLSG